MANQRELIKEGGLAVVGRYTNGVEVVGYHLSGNGMRGGRVTKEQLYSLIQKGAITNCTAQVYKGSILFRGKDGIKLSDLPVFDEKTGAYKNLDGELKGKRANGSLGKYILVERLMLGNELCAVAVRDAAGNRRLIDMQTYRKLVVDGSIINVTTQMNNGKVLYRYDKNYPVESRQIDNCFDYLAQIDRSDIHATMCSMREATGNKISGSQIYKQILNEKCADGKYENSAVSSYMSDMCKLYMFGASVDAARAKEGKSPVNKYGTGAALVAGYISTNGLDSGSIVNMFMASLNGLAQGVKIAASLGSQGNDKK